MITGVSVLGLGNLGGKRHPSINNIPLSFLKLKDSFPLFWMVAGGQSEFWRHSLNFHI